MSKNEKLLESFTAYCKMYPELRFWQALRGWAGVGFVYLSDKPNFEPMTGADIKDTYYWENKNN